MHFTDLVILLLVGILQESHGVHPLPALCRQEMCGQLGSQSEVSSGIELQEENQLVLLLLRLFVITVDSHSFQ